jgi:alkyl hydroperoxide reductase subunit F
MYDLVIIGGGPAGCAAAIYAARKRLKTVLVTGEWGGQSNVSPEIYNWIGTPRISGANLGKNLRAHTEEYKGEFLDIRFPVRATALKNLDTHVEVTLSDNTVLQGKTLLIASGSERRKLDVPGAKEYDQKGLTYCASCDGPLFADKDVVVIGGGNAAFESALQLLAYCKTVTLMNRTELFRADEITVASAKAHPNFRLFTNAVPTEVAGETFVTGLKYKKTDTGEESSLPVEGIFVEIGLIPNTEWLGTEIARNKVGQVIVDPKTQRAFLAASDDPTIEGEPLEVARAWAAGDCTNGLYHQNNIATGDAVKALEDIYIFLRRNGS